MNKIKNIKPYSEWDLQSLDNELKFLYIEIGRQDIEENAENINVIRKIEKELTERRIKRIANEVDIKKANEKRDDISGMEKNMKEIYSILENKKEVNKLNFDDKVIYVLAKESIEKNM